MRSPCSSLERLEPRIAPAAIVTVTLEDGLLHFVSAGPEGFNLVIEQISSKEWHVIGGGAEVRLGNGPSGSELFIPAPKGSVEMSFEIGEDMGVDLKDLVVPKNLLINGPDDLSLFNCTVRGSVTVHGADGDIDFSGRTIVGGRMDIDNVLSAGFRGRSVTLGALDVECDGDFSADPDLFVVKGDAIVHGVSDDDVSFTGLHAFIGGNLTVETRGEAEQVRLNPLNTLRVGKALTVNTGAGDDSIEIGVGSLVVRAGSLNIIAGGATDNSSEVVNISPAVLLNVTGDASIQHGPVGDETDLASDTIRIGGNLTANLAAAGNIAGSDHFNITTGTSFKLLGNLEVIGGLNAGARLSQESKGLLSIGGTAAIHGMGTGSADFGFRADRFIFKQGITANAANSGAFVTMEGGDAMIGGPITVDSPVVAQFSIFQADNVTVKGKIHVQAGTIVTSLTATGRLALAELDLIGNSNTALIHAKSGVIRDVYFQAATTGELELTGSRGALVVGSLSADWHANGGTARLEHVAVTGGTSLLFFGSQTSQTAAYIDDCTFKKAVLIQGGSGDNQVLVDTLSTVGRLPTTFAGPVTINLLTGIDRLEIGVAGDSTRRVIFAGTALFQSTDTYLPNNVTFRMAGEPTLQS